jgi:hypothetical protein
MDSWKLTMTEEMEDLRMFLMKLPPGHLEDRVELLRFLEPAWPEIVGSERERMNNEKLDRMESLVWMPPNLSFSIERHGAMVAGGSSRAKVQTWEVDVVEEAPGSPMSASGRSAQCPHGWTYNRWCRRSPPSWRPVPTTNA